MKKPVTAFAWICVVLVVVGFVLPWVRLDVTHSQLLGKVSRISEDSPVGGALSGVKKGLSRITATIQRGTETITGELNLEESLPREITGIQIPQLANSDNAKVAIIIAGLLTKSQQQIGLKSYAVYLLPGLALLSGLLITFLGKKKSAALGVAVFCAAISGIGLWKLLTLDTQALLIKVAIGEGLWMSLWAYAGLSLSAFIFVFRIGMPSRSTSSH